MKLFIRHKQGFITFVHSVQELKDLIEIYIPGKRLLIGDLSTFNAPMFNLLLKFVEENPSIDVYTSTDIMKPILLSRFVEVIKDPLILVRSGGVEEFLQSDRSYLQAQASLSVSTELKIRAPLTSNQSFKIINSL